MIGDPDKIDSPAVFGLGGGILSLFVIGIGAVGYLIVFATAMFRIVRYEGFEALMLLYFWMVWTFVGSAIGVLSVFAARLKGRPPHPLAKRGEVWGFWAAVVMLVLGFGH